MVGVPAPIEEHGTLITGFQESSSSGNQLQYRQDNATGSVADYLGPGFLKTIIVQNETSDKTHTLNIFDNTVGIFYAEIPPQIFLLGGSDVEHTGADTFVYHFPEPGLYFSGPLKSSGDSSQLRTTAIAKMITEDSLNDGGMPSEIEQHGMLTARMTTSSADTYTNAAYYRATAGGTSDYTGAGFIKSLILTNNGTASDKLVLGDNTAGGVVEIFRCAVTPVGAAADSITGHGPTVINFPEPGLYFSGTLQQKSLAGNIAATIVVRLESKKAVA